MFRSRTWTTTGRSTIWAAKGPISAASAIGAVKLLALCVGAAAFAQPATPSVPALLPPLQLFSKATSEALPAPWRLVGLPKGKAPLANFEIVALGADRVLKLATDKSYGTALHEVKPTVLGVGSSLKWRWQLDQPIRSADLTRKEGDDSPLKVCAMFDMPLDKLGFVERNVLRLARTLSGERLPAATLCYVWDHKQAPGSQLPNAYSPRLRFVVLDSGDDKLGQWVSHERDLVADLNRAFGHEFVTPPPLIAVVVGADSDNTQSSSLAYLGDIILSIKPPE